jgi:hypothetical protein
VTHGGAGTLLLAALLASGCVIVPVPEKRTAGPNPASRTNLDAQAEPGIVTGVTTRTQVLLKLGEPDGRGAEDAWFTYASIVERGGWHWYAVVIGPGVAGSPVDSWDTSRRLIIRFDAHGVVSAVTLEQKDCNASERNCVPVAGSDLAEADRRAAALAVAGTVVATYDRFQWFATPSGCEPKAHSFSFRMGSPLIVGEKGLAWQEGYARTWNELSASDVQAIQPPERHGFITWIPVQKGDGSCVYLRVLDSGVSADQVWSAMHAHLPAAPAPNGAVSR